MSTGTKTAQPAAKRANPSTSVVKIVIYDGDETDLRTIVKRSDELECEVSHVLTNRTTGQELFKGRYHPGTEITSGDLACASGKIFFAAKLPFAPKLMLGLVRLDASGSAGGGGNAVWVSEEQGEDGGPRPRR